MLSRFQIRRKLWIDEDGHDQLSLMANFAGPLPEDSEDHRPRVWVNFPNRLVAGRVLRAETSIKETAQEVSSIVEECNAPDDSDSSPDERGESGTDVSSQSTVIMNSEDRTSLQGNSFDFDNTESVDLEPVPDDEEEQVSEEFSTDNLLLSNAAIHLTLQTHSECV